MHARVHRRRTLCNKKAAKFRRLGNFLRIYRPVKWCGRPSRCMSHIASFRGLTRASVRYCIPRHQLMAIPCSVVVVDGNALDRTNTVALLEAAGYRVRSARSFDEAKMLLAADPPDILDHRLAPRAIQRTASRPQDAQQPPGNGGPGHQPRRRSGARGRSASTARALHPRAAHRPRSCCRPSPRRLAMATGPSRQNAHQIAYFAGTLLE